MTILDVMAKYGLDPQKQGDIWVCFCPFHTDVNRPNFTIYPATDSWFCYTCSKGGDGVFFVQLAEGISRDQATSRLYDNLQILVDKLNRKKEEVPSNGPLSIQIGKQCRDFLFRHPEKLPAVISLLKEVDEQLNKDLALVDATELLRQFSSHLNTLQK